jgi:hypothetical protein
VIRPDSIPASIFFSLIRSTRLLLPSAAAAASAMRRVSSLLLVSAFLALQCASLVSAYSYTEWTGTTTCEGEPSRYNSGLGTGCVLIAGGSARNTCEGDKYNLIVSREQETNARGEGAQRHQAQNGGACVSPLLS